MGIIEYQNWINNGKELLIIDAESDGLYGDFLSIGAVYLDERGEIADQFYGERDLTGMNVEDSWIIENVVAQMKQENVFTCEKDLLNAFWDFWLRYKDQAYCMADVEYPVETHLFGKCIKLDPDNRTFNAPFPLLDLSSILLVKGIDPLIDRRKLIDTERYLKPHHALNDVINTAHIWKELVK